MQGNYNELVQSNKNFINMNNLSHKVETKGEDIRSASEMSMRKITIRRISGLSTSSNVVS